MDSSMWSVLVRALPGLLGVAFFVLLNGFFVAAEFGLVSVRRTRIEQLAAEGHKAAIVARRAISDPDNFIAATQLGITLASLSLGWIGESTLVDLIEPLLHFLPEAWVGGAAYSIAATVAFIIITFLHVVVGELAPKSIALQHPERTALVVARPTEIALIIFRLPILVLNGAGNFLLRLVGIQPASGHEQVHSVQELKMLIEASHEEGVLEEQEEQMLQAVFDMRASRALHVMVPRTEMVCIPADAELEKVIELAARSTLTKFPVFEGDLDHIVGVVYVKDVIRHIREQENGVVTRALMRDALFLPEAVLVAELLAAFRRARQHIAILVDEYGGTVGLVTLEDLLEEIVGDIQDAFDHDGPGVQRMPDGSVIIDGMTQVEDVNEALGLSLEDPYYTTIGGLLMGSLDRIPVVGDEVPVGDQGVRLRVKEMDGLRVSLVRLTQGAFSSSAEGIVSIESTEQGEK
ncbi:MAG: HlyC/CorC family transporter [Chloroflexi bacterium]|nr:HlyC/CorC family transporter [Chloroflexota bacterium]